MPIFEIADIGLVGDLFKLLPELQTALKAYRNTQQPSCKKEPGMPGSFRCKAIRI